MAAATRPIAIDYEHPDWFRPLFAERDRRGTSSALIDATTHSYDATDGDGSQSGLVFNRMSPSLDPLMRLADFLEGEVR